MFNGDVQSLTMITTRQLAQLCFGYFIIGFNLIYIKV